MLTLTSGNVTTSSNTLTIGLSGAVSRTSGYIVGNLERAVPTGNPTVNFDIGDASYYTPVSLTFTTVSDSGLVTASTTAGDHPDVLNSGVNSAKSANRYWTLSDNGSVAFASVDATFTFDASDVDVGSDPLSFIVVQNDGSWSEPTLGTVTSTTTQATGLTTFGDFQVGESSLGVITSTAAGGLWSSPSTWIGGVVPPLNANVVIATTGSDSVTLNMNTGNLNTVTINSGSKLSGVNGYVLAMGVTSGTTFLNNGTFNAFGADVKVRRNSQWDGSGVFNLTSINMNFKTLTIAFSSPNTISLDGAGNPFSNPGVIVPGTNTTFEFDGTSAQTIPVSTYTFNSIVVNNAAGISPDAAITSTNVTGDITIGSGIFNDGGFAIDGNSGKTFQVANEAALELTGTNSFPTTFTPSLGATSTVDYQGSNQNVRVADYGHLLLTNSGTKTFLAGTTGIAGTLSVSGGAAADATTFSTTIDFNGSTSQTIPALSFNNLSSSNTGARTLASSGTIGIGGTFTPGSNSYTVTGSTVNFSGSGSQTIPAFDYNNLTSSSSGARTLANSGAIGIAGTFTPGSNSYTISGSTVDFNGSGSQTIPAFDYNKLTSSSTGARTLAGSGTIRIAGVFTKGTNSYTTTGSTVEFNGSSLQSISGLTFSALTINNANGIVITDNTTVNGVLTLTSGTITTNANKVSISSTGSISRTSGHVSGNLEQYIATGATSKTFDIGSSSDYTPIQISFASVTTAGMLTASTTTGDHPSIGTSGLNALQSANRYWTLANNGIVFTNYDATFNFVPTDVDGGATPTTFILKRYTGGTWNVPTIGTRTSTSIQELTDNAFGDYQAAQAAGQGLENYAITQTDGISYNSIAGTGNSVESWRNSVQWVLDDNRSYPVPLGFDFWYNGVRYTEISVGINGFADFSSSTADGSIGLDMTGRDYDSDNPSHNRLSNTTGYKTWNALAPLYGDISTQNEVDPLGWSFKYYTSGASPNRIFTLEWINCSIWNQSNTGTSFNFQIKLYEGSGKIEYVYGTMNLGTAPSLQYKCGFNAADLSGGLSAAVLQIQQTANSTNFLPQRIPTTGYTTTLPNSNSKLTFTPVIPSAPTGFDTAYVTQTSMRLKWTDVATNEIGYVIYRSQDGSNFTFVRQIAANSTYSDETGLQGGTTYYWRIYAVSEGGVSSALVGSQATLVAGTYTSAQTGNWNTPATWVGNAVPTPSANVIIADGHTVTLDTNATVDALTVGQGTSGILRIGNSAVARSLTVVGDITVNSGATFDVNTAYTQMGHSITLSGNIVNNGTLNLGTSGTSAAAITFNKSAGTQTIQGNGSTTKFYTMNVNVGTSTNDILDVFPSNFSTLSGGFLTLTSGTFRFSSAAMITPFTSSQTITANTGLWINNASAVVNTTTGNLTVSGLLRLTTGTLNVGSAADNRLIYSGGTINIEGGALNIAGRFEPLNLTTLVNFSMSGGTITVPTVGSTSTTASPIDISVPGSTFNWTNGRIVIQQEGGSGAENLGYINMLTTNYLVTGGSLQVGNSQTPSADTIKVKSAVPVYAFIDSSANATILLDTSLTVTTDVSILGGGLSANISNLTLGGNWNNTGTFAPGTGTVIFNGSGTQTISRTGGETFNNLTINKSSGTASLSTDATVNSAFSISSGTFAVNNQAFTLNGSVSSSGTLTANSSSTVNYSQTSAGQTIIAANYGNLSLNAYSKTFPSGTVGVFGTFTAPNPATPHNLTGNTIDFNGSGGQVITATTANFSYNNLTISNGSPKNAGGAVTTTGNLAIGSSITFAGGTNAITVNGNIANAGSFTGSGAGAVVLSGGSASHTLSGGGSYQNLTVNDANGAALSGSITVNGILTLTDGVITAAADSVMIASGGSVSGGSTSSHINGFLRKAVSTGNSTVSFEVGDATNYSPVSVQFYNTTTGGTLTSIAIASDHPDIANSPVEPTNDVNRYWTLRRSGLAFDSSWVTMNYVASDVDQPGGELSFLAGRYEGASWSSPVMGTRTSTSAVAQSVFSFGDFVVGGTTAASAFRSFTSGAWENTGTWERFDGASWINPAPSTPTGAASNSIKILNGHTITINADVSIDQTTIDAGGQLAIAAGTVTVSNGSGTDLTVNGTLKNSSGNDITTTGTITVGSTGTYTHNRNGGNVPTATWNSGSTCEITGVTTTAPGNLNQSFYHLTWNSASQTGALNLGGALATINGNLSFTTTNSGSVTLYATQTNALNIAGNFGMQAGSVVLKDNSGAANVNVAGSLNVSGGTLRLTSNGAVTMNVNGNVSISGTPTLDLSSNAAVGILRVKGNYSHTGGTVTVSGSATTDSITFNGTAQQTYTSGGSVTNAANFLVSANSNLLLGASDTVSGGGAFTLSSGATLGIKSTAGITSSGANGNVQVTGTRSFSTSANYIYSGTSSQATGNGLPATVNKLAINNSAGVSLSSSVATTDSLKLLQGTLNIGTTTLTINAIAYRTSGSLTSSATGTVLYNQGSNGQAVLDATYGNLTFSNYNKVLPSGTIGVAGTFTKGTASGHTITGSTFNFNGGSQSVPAFTYYNLTLSGSGTKTLGGNITVNNNLSMLSGSLADNGYTLTAKGNITNNIAHTGAGRILLNSTSGTDTLSGTGSYTNLELNNPVYGAKIQGDLTINGTLILTSGLINATTDTVVVASTGSVSRSISGGHVYGYLKKSIATSGSPQNYRLEVGDAATYAPVDMTFISVSTPGTVTASTAPGNHPQIQASGLDSTKDVFRTWTVNINAVVYSTWDGTFNFVSGDVQSGANTAYFFARRYFNSVWSAPSSNVRTSTSTKGVGFTGGGSFAVGELSAIMYWTGSGGTSSWNNAQNWSALGVPTSGNEVQITMAATIDVDVAAYAKRVVVSNSSAVLNILSGYYLRTQQDLTLQNGRVNIQINNLDSLTAVNFTGGTVAYTVPSGNQIVRDTVYNNLEVSGGGVKSARGNLTVSNTLSILGSATLKDSVSTITVNGNVVNSGTHIGSGKILLNGLSTQALSGGGSYTNLELNNSNGASVSGSKTTVNGTLTLTSGRMTVTSSADTLALSSSGSISRTSGYIVGNLQQYATTGALSLNFPVGSAAAYSPVRLQFANVTTAGYLTILRKDGQHPNISHTSALVDSTQDVNRYWKVVNNGVVLSGTYSITVGFANPSEFTGSPTPTGTNFIGSEWNGSSWSSVTIGQRYADSTRIDGLTAFQEYVIGNALAALVTAVTSGSWDDPAVWGGRVPGINDTIQINNTITITLNIDAAIAKLVINTGGIFDNGTYSLTVTGNFILDGSWSGAGKISLTTGNDTIFGNGSVTGTSLLEIAGNNKVIASTANLTLKNVSILAGDTLRNNGTAALDTVAGGAANSTFINASGSTLVINGQMLSTGTLDAAACPNTVTYAGTVSQQVKTATYCTLTTINSGGKTIPAGTVDATTFIVTGTSGLVTNDGTLNIGSGGLIVEASATLLNNATLTVTGSDIDNEGTITNDGTLTLD